MRAVVSDLLEQQCRSAAGRRSSWAWVVPALVVSATVVTYAPGLRGEFLYWDDYYNLVNNPHVRGFTLENLEWMFRTFHNRIYEPLSWIAKAAQYELWGLQPLGFHAYSLAWHVVNALLVYVIALRLFSAAERLRGRSKPAGAPASPAGVGPNSARSPAANEAWEYMGAGLAALWFSLHPLRVECVSLISAQPHVQAATFFLLAVWFYLRFCERESVDSPRALPWPVVLLFVLSLLSKATALGLPAALLVLDVYPLGRWKRGRRWRLLSEKLPLVVLSATALVIAVYARADQTLVVPLERLGLGARIAQASFCVVFHLYKAVVPGDLAPIYVMLDGFDPLGWRFVGSVVLAAALTLVCVGLRRRAPALWGAWVFYLVMLVPFMGLTGGTHYPVDRYTYVSMLGFVVLGGAGVKICGRARRRRPAAGRLSVPIVSLAVVLCVVWGLRSWRQTYIWKNSVVLLEHVLNLVGDYPQRSWMVRLLARALAAEGRFQEALVRYKEAVQVDPNNRDAYWELGLVAIHLKRWEDLAAADEKLYRFDPNDREVNLNLGTALVMLGEPERGIFHLKQVIRIDPKDYRGYCNLAKVLTSLGRHRESLRVLEEGMERTGGHRAIADRLAWLLATCPEQPLRDGPRALLLAEEISREAGGKDPRSLDVLAAALAESGQFDRAARTAREALQLCEARGTSESCGEIRVRLELYLADQPYHQAPSPDGDE
jgi:tetratricopeptide (TPR) repeat protein